MSDIRESLELADDADLDQLKAMYEESTKMLFALIQSIEDTVSKRSQKIIFDHFSSLTGLEIEC